ncbi:MAP kinase Pmk1 [Clonorchis sinensis]|uniref:MAP kinase Pmk1 n=1 Tax=Clonorchis sinensis TaxID=79923 RepID=A0A8T1MKV4_CLOSI|nr:MAP kinase Pmk1 [Clonorchis sinensis]
MPEQNRGPIPVFYLECFVRTNNRRITMITTTNALFYIFDAQDSKNCAVAEAGQLTIDGVAYSMLLWLVYSEISLCGKSEYDTDRVLASRPTMTLSWLELRYLVTEMSKQLGRKRRRLPTTRLYYTSLCDLRGFPAYLMTFQRNNTWVGAVYLIVVIVRAFLVDCPMDSVGDRCHDEARSFIDNLEVTNPPDLSVYFSDFPEDGVDLLRHLLQLDPDRRYTASQALAHRYFELYHDEQDEPTGDRFVDALEEAKDVSVQEWKEHIWKTLEDFVPKLNSLRLGCPDSR